MNKDRVVWLDNGWFPFRYCFCPSEKAWDMEMKRLKIKDNYGYLSKGQCGRCDIFECDGDLVIFVSISDSDHTDNTVAGLIVHEAMHVLQHMLEHIGEQKPSKEFEAYSIQTISQNIFKAYHGTRGFKGWDYKKELANG